MATYIVNTNRKEDPTGTDEAQMLREKIVALYFHDYKEKINLLQEGDTVLLYATGIGLLAYGTATGQTKIRNYQGKSAKPYVKGEYFQNLKKFKILKNPFSYAEITKVAGKRQNVTRAIFKVNDQLASKLIKKLDQQC